MSRPLLLTLILTLLCAISTSVSGENLFFYNISTAHGLNTSSIRSVSQDKYGFMWFATERGVYRYDGNRILPVYNNAALSSTSFAMCFAQLDEVIYAGTTNGLYSINLRTHKNKYLDIKGNNEINTIYVDDKTLWIGTNTGIVRLKDGKVTEYNNRNCDLSNNIIRSIYKDSDNNMWVGTKNGLNKITPDGKFKRFYFKNNYKLEKLNNLILDIKSMDTASDQTLLVGTETGLVVFDRVSEKFDLINKSNSALSDEVIKSIYVNGDKIWLGTNFGLNIIDKHTWEIKSFFHESLSPYTISSNVIWQIYRDTGGVMWLATDNGLCCMDQVSSGLNFKAIFHQRQNKRIGMRVRAIASDSKGKLYFATDNGIASMETGNSIVDNMDKVNKSLLMPNVTEITIDASDKIWIGTTGGLNIYDPSNGTTRSFTTGNLPGLTSNYLASIVNSGDKEALLSVWDQGIVYVTTQGESHEKIEAKQLSPFPAAKIAICENTLWCIVKNRIVLINIINGQLTEMTDICPQFKGYKIESLHIKCGKTVMAGSNGCVLIYGLEDDSFRKIEMKSIMNSNVINITEDMKGEIWGTTNSVIFKIDNNFRESVIKLGEEFPIRTICPNCMLVYHDGTIYCGGEDGIISFKPDQLPFPNFNPPVYISKLSVNNIEVLAGQSVNGKVILEEDISLTQQLELNYSQRNISLEFASLHYGASKSNKFRYKMEGADKDWITTNEYNLAVYSNLPPGRYVFRLQGTNNYGQWSDNQAVLEIRVLMPFAFRVPFLVLYALLLLLFTYWLFKLFTKRMRLLNELKIARLEKEHGEDMMKSKLDFFTNVSHDFRTPLSLIVPPLKEALNSVQNDDHLAKLLGIAYENSEKLMEQINQLLEMRRTDWEEIVNKEYVDIVGLTRKSFNMFLDSATRKMIGYKLMTDSDLCIIEIDPIKFEAILFNLLSNAFKFTPDYGEITLALTCKKEGFVEVSVSDTGIGINEKHYKDISKAFFRTSYAQENTSGWGIGLSIVDRYLTLLGGTLEIKSSLGNGTTFTVRLSAVDMKPKELDAMQHQTQDVISSIDIDERPLILYVEDNQNMVDFFCLTLGEKYRIITAQNGIEGYEKCVKHMPDIVISDIMMPSTDGMEMSRMIKDNVKTRHIPIIILTAKSSSQSQIEGLRAGIDLYIVKPVLSEILEANIEKILSRRKETENYLREELVVVDSITDGNLSDPDKKLLKNIVENIEKNISDPSFSVDQLCRSIGISPSHMFRQVKKITGLNTNDLIRKYRLKKASVLLKGKKGNISEIMYYVGFTTPSYFSKCFKSEFGVTPNEFREIYSDKTQKHKKNEE